jgi:PEP-CTERM motif
MKIYLGAALLSVALAGSASAAISVSLANGNNETFNNNPVGAPAGMSSAVYNGSVGPIEFHVGGDTAGVVVGSVGGIYATPLGDSSRYVYGLRQGTTVYFGSQRSPVLTTSFIINWGSIDALSVSGYDNILTLSNGNSVTGTDLVNLGLAIGNGSQSNPLNNRWLLIRDTTPFTSFTAYSARNSFEFDMTTVPEPATWAMLIAGFGMVGYAARRRERIARASA